MNTVHTYYEPVQDIDEGVQQKEIAVWRESWERWGWEAKVLGRGDVVITPAEIERLQRLPSVNPPGYEMACYLRWFAMRAIGGGLLTDYDVVNVGLRPGAVPPLDQSAQIRILCGARVPCVVQLTAAGADTLCELLLGYEVRPDDLHHGQPHISDQWILQRTEDARITMLEFCQEPQHADERARLLHVSHSAMTAMGLDSWYRHDVMKVLAGIGMARAPRRTET
jgi:hypothetical protein